MSLRDAFSGFMAGLRNVPQARPMVSALPGKGQIEVVDTSRMPTGANVPGSWSRAYMGPGTPIKTLSDSENARNNDAETEPRAFSYLPSINSTMTPRIAYGLTAFTDLRTYAESVPEVSMCLRILTEEMKAFVPTIVDDEGNKIPDSEYMWMTTRPDGFMPFPVWLSKFLYNVLVYDAGCTYIMRNSRKRVIGTRVIDGSTMFVLVDEKGEQPKPPKPAFQQIIWGTPLMMLNSRQIWYKPRHLRVDAPYGRSPIEDALPAVKLLSSLWEYEYEKYQVGNIPEMVFTVPEYWKDNVDAIFEFEAAFNARMAGNLEERARARFLPAGMTALTTKEMTFNRESYDAATNAVRMAYGIPQSEVGESPGEGLGGKGFAEAMTSTFYRMGLAPLISYVEGHFNDVIMMSGDTKTKFALKFPPESLDPSKEEEKYSTRFQIGGITRDEYRQGLAMDKLGGELGEFIVTPGGGAGGEEDGDNPFASLMGGGKPGMVNVGNKNNVQVRRPIAVGKNPVKVVSRPIAVAKYDQSEVERARKIGEQIGVDWNVVDPEEFVLGFGEEMEHAETVGNDEETMARITLDHLTEDPKYYSKLKSLFAKYDRAELAKFTGVAPEDDMLFGSPVSNFIDTVMPHQGANRSRIVSIGGGAELDARPAVWKPLSGESKKLQDWAHGELYRRSEAAYLLDRELAPDAKHYLVPVTFVAQIEGEPGSVQHYVTGRQPREEVTYYGWEWVERAAVLDYIMGQMDRVSKNWLTHPYDDDRPILIDSDLSFSPDKNQQIRSSFVNAMKDRQLSDKSLDCIYGILGNRDLWEDLADCLNDSQAVANARARAEELYAAGRISLAEPIPVSDGMVDVTNVPSGSESSRPILVKAEWEESKHPRADDGKFTSGAGGGGAGAPVESPKRIGTSTVDRAKQIIEARRIQDEKDKKRPPIRTSEWEEFQQFKREKNKRAMEGERDKFEVLEKDFRDRWARATGGGADEDLFLSGRRAAGRIFRHYQNILNGAAGLSQTEFNANLDMVNDVKALADAVDNKDVKAANAIRRKHGKQEKPEVGTTDKRQHEANAKSYRDQAGRFALLHAQVKRVLGRDDPELEGLFLQAHNEAAELANHFEGKARGERDQLDQRARENRIRHLQEVLGIEQALINKDRAAENAARRALGIKEWHTAAPPKPAKNPKWDFGRPLNMQPRPPDLANHAVIKLPKPRNYIHLDTPEKNEAMDKFNDWFKHKRGGEIQNVHAVEFYGKICQSGADFDGVRALIHVDGGLSQEQKEWNTYAGDYWDASHFTFRFVSDYDNNDRKDVEKIRRDNREFRLGNTSVHFVSRLGTEPRIRGMRGNPDTTGGTHGVEALRLKANPQAHIWTKLKDLKPPPAGGGGGKPPQPAGSIDPVVHNSARKFISSSNKRTADHLATGEEATRSENGQRGINPSWWVKIRGNGEGLMKKDGVMEGTHGIPETEVFSSDFAEMLGFKCVPVTTFRHDSKEGRCSIMEKKTGFEPAAKLHRGDAVWQSEETRRSFSELATLTILTGNYDRHEFNWMGNAHTGEVIAIDNGGGMIRAVRNSSSEIEAHDYGERYAGAGHHTLSGGVRYIGRQFEVLREHVAAAEKFINSPECDEVIARTFDGKDMVKILKKANPHYAKMSDADVITKARQYAKIQLEEGLKYLKKI